MRKTLSFITIFMMAFCAFAQDLYIGSFYVTTPDEEKLYGDGGDKWATRRTYICDLFNFEQPDVLGLQSATESQVSFINQRMTSHNATGNIIYKKELELVSNGAIEEMPEGSTTTTDSTGTAGSADDEEPEEPEEVDEEVEEEG